MSLNRSDIDLAANASIGQNLGTGTGVFKCKDVTGNTMQFRTISVTGGSLSIISGTGDTIIISGASIGGSLPVMSGMTNYLIKATSTGITKSSIYDSGTTRVHLQKDTVFIGDGISVTPVTIKPSTDRKIEVIAGSGVNIGSLTNCLCIGDTPLGLTLCSAAYCDLLVHAGSTGGGAGKKLYLSGGDGSTLGGNVVISGGTGNAPNNAGKIQLPTLLGKTTETCAVYIDSNGFLSKGFVPTGTTISGTQNYIPVFNTAGNNIQNSSLSFISNVLCNNNNLTIETADSSRLYLYSPTVAGNVNIVTLGKPSAPASITCTQVCPTGTATNIDLQIFSKGNGYMYLSSPTMYIGSVGCNGMQFTSTNSTLMLPSKVKVCGYGGVGGDTDGKPVCIIGGTPYTQPGNSGHGGGICLLGADGGGTIAKSGGTISIKAGLGVNGGINGRIQLCGLPSKSTETCVLYVDATGKLSTGTGSTGGGGGGGVSGIGWSNLANGNTIAGCGTLVSGSSTLCNTFYGVSAGKNTGLSGSGNVATGYQALYSNTSGCFNVASGYQALYSNTSSSGNTAIGLKALYSNTIGKDNIAIGRETLYTNSGSENISIGCKSLCSNSGSRNIGIGKNVLNTVNSGSDNIAIGNEALMGGSPNSGGNNIAIGVGALRPNSTGAYNVAIGEWALCRNVGGNFNTAVGPYAMVCSTDGTSNVGIGYGAMRVLSTGAYNVGIGQMALTTISSGGYNIGIGVNALSGNTSGSNNIGIGYVAGCSNKTGTNNVFLGNYAGITETGSNKLHIAGFGSGSLIYGEFNNNYLQVNSALSIPYLPLTFFAGTITWNMYQGVNRYMTATGSFTLDMTNLREGMSGDLRLATTTTTTITLPVGSKLNGSVTALPAGTYHLGFVYAAGFLDFNIGVYY